MSKAGKYFAKRGTLSSGGSQTYDPVQFSCQKNFAMLTTDGYWNNNNETSAYGPYSLDGSSVGQQDGSAPRPLRDGGVETYTVTTPMQQLLHTQRTRTQTRTTVDATPSTKRISCSGGSRRIAVPHCPAQPQWHEHRDLRTTRTRTATTPSSPIPAVRLARRCSRT